MGVDKGERGTSNGGHSGNGKVRYVPPHLRGKTGGAGGAPDDRPPRDNFGDDRQKERGKRIKTSFIALVRLILDRYLVKLNYNDNCMQSNFRIWRR